MKKGILLIVIIALTLSSFAQTFKSYTVKAGETIYSISKNNNITESQLRAVNPSIISGLRAGQIINIPISKTNPTETNIIFSNYKVKKKDTLYSIAKQYGVTVNDILKYNPWAEKAIAKKDILRIPNAFSLSQQKNVEIEEKQQNITPQVSIEKYEVKSGETLYGISRKYNRSIDALLAENPQVRSGLKVGMILNISIAKVQNQIEVSDDETILYYTVKAGDTAFGISKEYGISIDELYSKNPEVKSLGLQINQVLEIPTTKQKESEVEGWTHQPAEIVPNQKAKNEEYRVALLLPFSLDEDTSGTVTNRNKTFLQMYQGVLLAIDKMRANGMNVTLAVFDTKASVMTIKNIMRQDAFKRADLIIGPVHPNTQSLISEYSKTNSIPMISPMSSAGNYEQENPYYYKVLPTPKFIDSKTKDFLFQNFKTYNMVTVKVGGYGNIDTNNLNEIKTKFARYNEYEASSHSVNTLKSMLIQSNNELDMKNVIYIPFDDETKISAGISQLYALPNNYKVTLVGLSNYTKFNSIQTEYYHKLNMHILSPLYVNYTSKPVVEFIKNYRGAFYTEPTKFSFQGYDVAYYFLSMLYTYGRNIEGATISDMDLLQSHFQFRKQGEKSGWMNEGLFIIEYKSDFTIVKKGETK